MISLLDVPGLRRLLTSEPPFARALIDMAQKLGLNPNYILGVMSNESGLRPSIVNPQGGATGLIQFMPATAKGLGTTVEMLRQMSGVQQLEYVRRYFAPYIQRIRPGVPGDYYMAVFMPAFVGAPATTVLGEQGSSELIGGVTKGKIYDQNKGLDTDKDGKITVADVTRKIEATLRAAAQKPVLEAPDVPLVPGQGSALPLPSLPPAWRSSGAPSDLPVLRIGAKGNAVTLAQVLLSCDVITGVYTEAMAEDYVEPFQTGQGLRPDKVIGPFTWEALAAHLKDRPTEPPPRTAPDGIWKL